LSSLLSLLAVGFFLGVRHATDADHVVAIATIVTRERRLSAAAAIGVLWGVGHGLTVAVVGCAIILFGVVIPPRVGLAMEFAVGIMLVILGVFTLAAVARQAREALALHLLHGQDAGAHGANVGGQAAQAHGALDQEHGHSHVHTHGDYVHSHEHGHSHGGHGHSEHSTPQAWLDRHFGRLTPYQALRPVIVGVVHGLAGSAAVGLLALAAVRDPFWGLVYLFVFGLGTIIGMMLITLVIAAPFAMSAQRLPVISSSVRAFAGALSLVFGLFLMYQIGVAGGLFSDSP
jgi:high-affinity nickel-transport protein